MNFFTFLTLIIGYFVYLTYRPYLLDIAIASLMAIAFSKIEIKLSEKIKNRYLLASFITLVFALLIFGPLLYFIIVAGKFITHINIEDIKIVILKAQNLLTYLPNEIAGYIKNWLTDDNIQKIYQSIMPIVGTLTAKSAVFIKDAFLIVVFFFFAILYGKDILLYVKKVIPLEDDKLEKLYFTTSEVMSVVFYSTVFTALLEGALFGFIVSLYGLNFFFFAVMYAFASLIPVVGGLIMWAPVSLYFYANGNIQAAIVIIVYSIVIISIIADTFIKPLIIAWVKKFFGNDIEFNSLLIFFAIVAGLSSFGLWGIIIGPAITALFISVLKYYEKI
ncbi:AI-2E family transporter [Caminibacter pacificus]|uniref:AI-2E family transporter n=1 Tax=Caminibacter pacificus TaxID=1424653 RepID=A0AAJ4RDG4_9BACT|nr:AI-2E family transporter [Caminibacter pacificus]NPA87961.1 AI-2E family transporter [Campylobacterota bacterium]QCI28546.1 AI-2E family transporter [Caminibacter pacificus]ROR40727.1 putative PurR-regulated permease PerM [Caminibacter pacificus]